MTVNHLRQEKSRANLSPPLKSVLRVTLTEVHSENEVVSPSLALRFGDAHGNSFFCKCNLKKKLKLCEQTSSSTSQIPVGYFLSL